MAPDRKAIIFATLFILIGLADVALAIAHGPISYWRALLGIGFFVSGAIQIIRALRVR